MLYNISNMNLSNVKKDITFKQNVNENYTTTALKEIHSINESYNESLVEMAKSITLGKPINEAVNIFLSKNLILMDNTTVVIEKMISSFKKELSKMYSDRKFFIEKVEQIKDKTEELGNSAITLEGYFYTEMKQPNVLLASEFKKGYSELLSKDPKVVYDKIMDYYSDGYMNRIRKETLNQSVDIPDKLMRDKIYGFYRNNCTSETVVVYKEAQVADAIRKYLDFNVYLDNLDELYTDIKTQVSEVKRCIELLTKKLCTLDDINHLVYGDSMSIPDTSGLVEPDFNDCIKVITKKKVSYLNYFVAMYMMLVADKISAMKSALNQNTIMLDSFYNMIFLKGDEQ